MAKMTKSAQSALLIGAALTGVWLFASLARGREESVLPSETAPVPDASLLASGGMPPNPTWYWGANAPIGSGDIYMQVNPDVAATLGDAYTPLFGFVGFAGY